MRITILFGGTNKERLVSVASAQAMHQALPDAELWFWDADNTVHETRSEVLLKHSRPFEDPFKPGAPSIGTIELALDRAKAEDRVLVLGLHGGNAENGELQAMCEMRGIPFTGSGSASSHLAFDKIAAKRFAAIAGVPAPADLALDDLERALAQYGRLIAKPRRGSAGGEDRRISHRTVCCGYRGYLRRAGAIGWVADRVAANRNYSGRRTVRLRGQISRQSDARDLSGTFYARDQRRTDGSGSQGTSGPVMQRLLPFGLHRHAERTYLS